MAFAAGNLLHPLEHTDAAYQSATWEAAHLVIFFSLPMLVLGLPALHRALVPRVGSRLSTIAVVASIVGLIGIGPGTIIETFVAPMIGHEAMTELESGGMGAVNGLLGSAYLGGTIALGWALWRSRLRPRLRRTGAHRRRGRAHGHDDRHRSGGRRRHHHGDRRLRPVVVRPRLGAPTPFLKRISPVRGRFRERPKRTFVTMMVREGRTEVVGTRHGTSGP